jgi:hypothetical protein
MRYRKVLWGYTCGENMALPILTLVLPNSICSECIYRNTDSYNSHKMKKKDAFKPASDTKHKRRCCIILTACM